MTGFRLFVFAVCLAAAASGQRVGVPTTDLDKVSVDELFSVEVTSVDRKAQQLAKSPAAVFVLTSADIHRSGATCIPEALQLVPGLTVLHLDGRSWVVSARGGARLYSDQMLVMIDGRSVYTPMFSGVIWDAIDVPMEDIERIEVVRGPGAVMWGPNAVNGVINIITKNTRDTKGGLATVAVGNEQKASGEVRWGGVPSDRLSWRLWGKFDYLTPAYGSPGYFNYADLLLFQDPAVRNLDSASGRIGFRLDGRPTEKDQWMVQGDVFKTDRQDPLALPVLYPTVSLEQGHSDYFGGSIQGHWTHSSATGNEQTLQFSYDRADLDYSIVAGDLHNFTANYEWRRQTSERNEFYWGAGFQQYWDETLPGRRIAYDPANAVYRVGDAVFRDEYQFIPGRLVGSAGVRLDYISFHQFDYQPSLRLLYTPDSKQSIWLGASRAIRMPNRVDRDFDENAGTEALAGVPVQLWMLGSKAMRSEVERSLEAGYRFQRGQSWSFDASIFWSYYQRLRALAGVPGIDLTFQSGVPEFSHSVTTNNAGAGRNYGAEIWGTWNISPRWRLSPSYSYLNEARWLPPSNYYVYYWDGNPATLAHQAILRSQLDVTRHLQFDVTARAHSRDDAEYHIPGAFLLDARLQWRPWESGEVSLSAQNLTGRQIMEGYPELQTVAIPLRRIFVLRWTQRF